MRPAFRIVPAALAAFVVALALVTSAQSHRAPPHPSKLAGTVSSGVPYIAPWQSGFEKFATQVYTPENPVGYTHSLTIPDGQWWRIIYVVADYVTSAVAGNRSTFFEVVDPNNRLLLQLLSTAVQPASSDTTYMWGPGLTAFSNMAALLQGQQVGTLPDVLWPPRSTVSIKRVGQQAGDTNGALQIFAVEVYTEQRGALVPAKLTPTPLIP